MRDVKAAKLLALMDLWAAKEAVRKAVGAHTCSAKDLLLASARAEGGYIVCRFSRRAETDLMAVTLQSHEHVYAVSLAGL